MRGTKPPEQVLGQGNGEALIREVNRKQVAGTLADASSDSGRTYHPQRIWVLTRRRGLSG